jgi:hypothetical protein
MKAPGLLVSALALLLTPPTLAVEYQGKNIDGRKLPANIYSYKTGGLYEAQVQFKQDFATIYFVNGSQLTIRLNQRTITDPKNILGYGRPGQIPLSRWLAVGVGSEAGLSGNVALGAGRLEDLWSIQLNPSVFP